MAAADPQPLRLPWAPTYRPTSEEFADPLKYIASIRAEAEPFGICKIVPPAEWKPPFSINRAKCKFNTRIQYVQELQDRSNTPQARDAFYQDYERYLANQSRTLGKTPVFGGQEVDLYLLYKTVAKRGGYLQVTNEKAWKDVARILEVHRTLFRYISLLLTVPGEKLLIAT